MMKAIAALACLMASTIACANEPSATTDDLLIARVGKKTIHYKDIRCNARYATPPSDTRCHALEQQKLEALMTTELVLAAGRLYGITVSDDDALAAAPKGAVPSDAQMEQFAVRYKAIAKAVLTVREGAPADATFEKELAPRGIKRQEFDTAYAAWTAEDARKALSYDYAGETKRQIIAQHRMLLLLRRINAIATERAATRRQQPEEATRDLWSEVLTRSGAAVVDTRYSLPDLEKL